MKHFILLFIVFWNVENLFDCRDSGSGASDTEFSSFGERRWTRTRFRRKCNDIAKTLFWIADSCGRMPEIITFAEVENRAVMNMLRGWTALNRYDYAVVHYDSPDRRGIDVGMLYDRAALTMTSSRPAPVPGLRTRDMLVTTFITANGDSLAVVVCHHPSKYGGKSSAAARELAVKTLIEVSDSLSAAGWVRQVAVGDFNDIPESGTYLPLREYMTCLSDSLSRSGIGSIRFDGVWELIDQAYVSQEVQDASQEVLAPPFLTVPDTSYPGVKPFRTYLGPRYIGGVSDHYPILVRIGEGL